MSQKKDPPTPTPFAEKGDDRRVIKQLVANAAVTEILWPSDRDATNSILICDGSSALCVWIAYLADWARRSSTINRLKVFTNNLAVPQEWERICLMAPGWVKIEVAPGEFIPQYNGVFGRETERWAEQNAPECTCILPVTCLDGLLGPCTNDPDARALKKVILNKAKAIVVVADFDKLRRRRNGLIAVDSERWEQLLKSGGDFHGRLWVVTARTQANGMPWKSCPAKGGVDHRTEHEIESDNLHTLHRHLGQRLIVVDTS
jgi:DeoR/GlpR family transcriptional regulator of sugar metabolism